MPPSSPAAAPESVVVVPSSTAALQAFAAILFGVFIIGMTGFSHIEAVHNAAHDTRHSNAFPCH